MSDSPEDPPSFDSLLATPVRSSDGVVTVPSTISRRAAPGTNLERRDDNENLRLSNETFEEDEHKEVKRDGYVNELCSTSLSMLIFLCHELFANG
ncbi:unnamed protein product [Dibothriocephalus latus]|uniref:Uncharacterized protein n=1 Tax=Dibothriocephalus latus TaxID=60516 RepID=A0A3P7NV76_DIBLA|nr:unnamed protein product [Dibothriocephalus latus]